MAAIILVLMTRRGRTNGCAFLLGWILGLVLLLIGLALLFEEWEKPGTNQTGWTFPLVRLSFGIFMIGLAIRSWSRRPRSGEQPDTPSWMEALDQLCFLKSLLTGAALLVLNLKNFPIAVSAGAVLARYQSESIEFLSALLALTLISSLGVAAPVVVACLGGEKTDRVLQSWKQWLSAHNATILSLLFLAIGLTSLGRGLWSIL